MEGKGGGEREREMHNCVQSIYFVTDYVYKCV